VAERHRRTAAGALVGAIVVFAALEIPAMLLYPGGTWWDRAAKGHSFWQNFLCDLEWTVALNGTPNPVGSRLAQAAMLALILGFVPFWWIVPTLFDLPGRGMSRAGAPSPLGRAVRIAGLVSVAGMIAVALMPSDRFGAAHGVAVIVAGLPGLSAAVLSVVGLLRGDRATRFAGALGGAMLGFAILDFVLYAWTMAHGGPGPLLLPVAQKCALLLLLAWMLVVARLGLARATQPRPPSP
jgi:hypothetical protein